MPANLKTAGATGQPTQAEAGVANGGKLNTQANLAKGASIANTVSATPEAQISQPASNVQPALSQVVSLLKNTLQASSS